MADSNDTTIVLEVLRVASRDVLGATQPLSVASPCRFSNAKGDLREVESLADVSRTAAASARGFMQALRSPQAIF